MKLKSIISSSGTSIRPVSYTHLDVYKRQMFDNSMYSVPKNIQTRWCSPENYTGEKGKAGMTRGGRKGSAKFTFRDGEEKVLAFEKEGTGIVRRMWMTLSDFSKEVLRLSLIHISLFWEK